MPVKGTVENLDFRPEPQSPRVETLGEAITKVKLVGALTESNVSAEIEFLPTLGADGKTVSIRVESMEEDVKADLAPVLTAIRAVNEEGGGIVRYNVEFYQKESFIACASYDLLYGDEIISSLLSQE